MSKYQPLADHLTAWREPFWRASFADLEALLGATLPQSARRGDAWWGNTGTQSHQRAWLESGWEVESVDRAGEAVLFQKQNYDPDEVPERFFSPAPIPRRKGRLVKPLSMGVVVGGAAGLAAAIGALTFAVVRRRK